MHRRATRQRRRLAMLVVAVGVVAAACTGGSSGTPSTVTQVTSPPTTDHVDDGVLRIGAVLPLTGAVPDLGQSMKAALDLGVEEINAIGVRGKPIEVTVEDEGSTPATAAIAVKDFVDRGYDAIIGPTSSTNVLDTLGTAVNAGLLVCSPTATALALDDYPDRGLFFRTAPSDSLQAQMLVQLARQTGRTGVAIAYVDDAYGEPFMRATLSQLKQAEVVGTFGFPAGVTPPDEAAKKIVDSLLKSKPGVVIVLADAQAGPAIVTAIDNARAAASPQLGQLSFVVSDQIRRPAPGAARFGPDLAPRIRGASPAAYPNMTSWAATLTAANPSVGGLFAANAYDCLSLIALGAIAADSYDPKAIHAQLLDLTTSGATCRLFAECEPILESGLNVNYEGPSLHLDLDGRGNPTDALFDRFTFDPDTGLDRSDGSVQPRSG